MQNNKVRKINKENIEPLDEKKKKILLSLMGAASAPIDLNEIRYYEKYGEWQPR